MKTEVLEKYELKHIYLREFQLYTSDADITFNIVDINTDKMTITLAVTNVGKISVITYDLLTDKLGNLYFEYGVENIKVNIDDFEEIKD